MAEALHWSFEHWDAEGMQVSNHTFSCSQRKPRAIKGDRKATVIIHAPSNMPFIKFTKALNGLFKARHNEKKIS